METDLSCHPESSDNPAVQAQVQPMNNTLSSCHTSTNNAVVQVEEKEILTQDASIIGAQWFVETAPPISGMSDVQAGLTSSTTPEEGIAEMKPVLVHPYPKVELVQNLKTTSSLSRNTPEQFHVSFNSGIESAKDSLPCEQKSKIDTHQCAMEQLDCSSTIPIPLHDVDNSVVSNQLQATLTIISNEQPSCVASDVVQHSPISLLMESQEGCATHQHEAYNRQETINHQFPQLQEEEEFPSDHQNPVQETNSERGKRGTLKGYSNGRKRKWAIPKQSNRGGGKSGKNSFSQTSNACGMLERHATSVMIEEKDVIQLWRTIGDWKELSTDGDIARFLLSLYFNPDHKGVQSTDRCVHCDQVLSYCCMSCLLSSRQPPSTHLTSHSASNANRKQKQNCAAISSSSQDGNWNCELLQHQGSSGDDMAEDFCDDDDGGGGIETQNEQSEPSNKKQHLDTEGLSTGPQFETKCPKSFNTTNTPVVKLTRLDAQSVCVTEQINRGELTLKASNFESKHKHDSTSVVQASSSATKTDSNHNFSDQPKSEASTDSRRKSYRLRKRDPLPQETAEEEEERDKYPICDGIHFKNGRMPVNVMTYFAEYMCSKCNKTFAKKQEIIRHMKNPRCDTGDELFKSIQRGPRVSKSANCDEDWAPPEKEKAEHAEDCATDASDEDVDSSEKRKPQKRKHPGMRKGKVYTMEQFMAGKVQIPIASCNKQPRVYYSHYTCAKCCKVFTKLVPYKQHVADHKSDKPSDSPPPQGPDPESLKILEDIRDRLVHACSLCDRIFFSACKRDYHAYAHKYFVGDDGKFNCRFCGEKFNKYDYFVCHVRGQKSKNKQKECDECGFKFLSNCQRQLHMKEHKIKNSVESCSSCQVCETSFESWSKKEITAHLKTHKELRRMCLCTICGKKVPSNRLSKHKLMHSLSPECCEVCKISFASFSKKEIKAHLKTHKELRPMSLCTVCGKEMLASQLNKHKLIHGDIRPFKCPICQKGFLSNADMEYHKRIHGEKQLQCEECGAKFFQLKHLKNHIEFKHRGKTYDCNYCGRKLARNHVLQKHIREVHEKLKRFVCKICDRGFRTKNELAVHERIHTGEKPFKCQYCSSTFARRDYLRSHVRTHTGEKPYQCEDCVEKFTTRTSYTSHRKNHHSDKLYPCDQCSQVMLTKSDLAIHYQKWHSTMSDANSNSTDVVHADMKTEAGVSNKTASSDHVKVVVIPVSLV